MTTIVVDTEKHKVYADFHGMGSSPSNYNSFYEVDKISLFNEKIIVGCGCRGVILDFIENYPETNTDKIFKPDNDSVILVVQRYNTVYQIAQYQSETIYKSSWLSKKLYRKSVVVENKLIKSIPRYLVIGSGNRAMLACLESGMDITRAYHYTAAVDKHTSAQYTGINIPNKFYRQSNKTHAIVQGELNV